MGEGRITKGSKETWGDGCSLSRSCQWFPRCICQNLPPIHFEYVWFIVYQLYLSNAIRNFKKEKTLVLQHVSVQSVATIGNTLNSVHLAVEAIQKTVDEHKKTIESLQSDMVRKSTNAAGSKHSADPLLCNRSDAIFPFI